MKTKLIGLLLILIVFSGLQSCGPGEIRIPRSVGITSEILIVAQNNEQWKGLIGDTIRAFFEQPQYGLPQDESLFRLATIEVSNFSDMFKKHRNLFFIELKPELTESKIEIKSDVWAKPQRVIRISAPDMKTWIDTFNKHKNEFKLQYDQSERARIMDVFRPLSDGKLAQTIFESIGIKILIPQGFFIAKNEGNFIWLRREFEDHGEGILIYTLPYRDTAQFSLNQIIAVRDSLLRKHVPGPSTGSFMSTDKVFTVPLATRTNAYVTDFAVETRGVWNVVGDFMAGPFVSYTVVDPRFARLVTLEGYVYHPNKDKRDNLRQLESLLYSLEFPAMQ